MSNSRFDEEDLSFAGSGVINLMFVLRREVKDFFKKQSTLPGVDYLVLLLYYFFSETELDIKEVIE